MGMVLEHELSAGYAAGSLGGTLGRLAGALQRLERSCNPGLREAPGEGTAVRLIQPAGTARLNQTLRMMADAWQSGKTSRGAFGRIEGALDALKERALGSRSSQKLGLRHYWEYQLLAQALDNLKAEGRPWM